MAYRVLVIEDDAALADVLRMKLGRDGHEVAIAPTQQDAYHLLDESRFDFALLDLRLPTHRGDMDPSSEVGFDTLAHIRDRCAADKLPVIVMTAYEETSQTAVRALRAGANDYITKPFADSAVSLDEKLRDIVTCIERAKRGTKDGRPHRVVFRRDRVEVDGIVVEGKAADLLRVLGKRTLMLSVEGAAEGDRHMSGKDIAGALNVQEQTVRQNVARFRKWIAKEFAARNSPVPGDQDIIRNARDWKGYCLNLSTCQLIPA